jgi:hypothetical protein
MDEILIENNINTENILKIYVRRDRYIYKIKSTKPLPD